MNGTLLIRKVDLSEQNLLLSLSGAFPCETKGSRVRCILHFVCGTLDRRIPLVIDSQEYDAAAHVCRFSGSFTYYLNFIFYGQNSLPAATTLRFHVLCGNTYEEGTAAFFYPGCLSQDHQFYDMQLQENALLLLPKNSDAKPSSFSRLRQDLRERDLHGKLTVKNVRKMIARRLMRRRFNREKQKGLILNRITFLCTRTGELSENMRCLFCMLQKDPDLDLAFFFCQKDIGEMSRQERNEFAKLCAESKVILLDEYTPNIHFISLRPETKLIQLWHACGAFKTFGFSRLGKTVGSMQGSPNHRNYDYALVSGEGVRIWYAEGFGIPTDHVVATGVPRTDIFFDDDIRRQTAARLSEKYPMIRDKKVILFAPTFRGDRREEADYDMDRFSAAEFADAVGEDYILLIKHHPFLKKKQPIAAGYEERILDLSGEEEINDLLFVTDLLITDYSSVIFEASLLSIPMLFYPYDLEVYTKNRDFYYDYASFVPGPICRTQKELSDAVIEGAFDAKRSASFARRQMDRCDGHASERAAELILSAMREM